MESSSDGGPFIKLIRNSQCSCLRECAACYTGCTIRCFLPLGMTTPDAVNVLQPARTIVGTEHDLRTVNSSHKVSPHRGRCRHLLALRNHKYATRRKRERYNDSPTTAYIYVPAVVPANLPGELTAHFQIKCTNSNSKVNQVHLFPLCSIFTT